MENDNLFKTENRVTKIVLQEAKGIYFDHCISKYNRDLEQHNTGKIVSKNYTFQDFRRQFSVSLILILAHTPAGHCRCSRS